MCPLPRVAAPTAQICVQKVQNDASQCFLVLVERKTRIKAEPHVSD